MNRSVHAQPILLHSNVDVAEVGATERTYTGTLVARLAAGGQTRVSRHTPGAISAPDPAGK